MMVAYFNTYLDLKFICCLLFQGKKIINTKPKIATLRLKVTPEKQINLRLILSFKIEVLDSNVAFPF